jgi:hypothetical protein
MSKITGLLDPEARATIDAVFAKWAAPGMCNPEDESPCVDGEPTEQVTQTDTRSQSQRNHDALKAMAARCWPRVNWAHQTARLQGAAHCALRHRPRMHPPGLYRTGVLVPSPPRRKGLGRWRSEQHYRGNAGLRPRQSDGHRIRLDNPKRRDGRTEWIPPPHLDTGQTRVNDYHHQERYLLPEDDEDPG